MARVWNQASIPSVVRFTGPTPFQSAQALSHIETPLESLALKQGGLETTVGAQRMETFGFKL